MLLSIFIYYNVLVVTYNKPYENLLLGHTNWCYQQQVLFIRNPARFPPDSLLQLLSLLPFR